MDWEAEPLTEPLLTATHSSEELEALREKQLSVPLTWQWHTQGIEHAVRELSEACLMVVGKEKREAWIRCAEVSRRTLPKPET